MAVAVTANDEAYDLIMAVAAGDLDEVAPIASWLTTHSAAF